MKQGILEFWVGLFVLLGALALGVLAFRVAGGSQLAGGAATYTVYADFDDIGSLKVNELLGDETRGAMFYII